MAHSWRLLLGPHSGSAHAPHQHAKPISLPWPSGVSLLLPSTTRSWRSLRSSTCTCRSVVHKTTHSSTAMTWVAFTTHPALTYLPHADCCGSDLTPLTPTPCHPILSRQDPVTPCFAWCHRQVSTRLLCSASPLLYWFGAHVLLHRPMWRRLLVLRVCLGYAVVGAVLHALFLPWT